MLEPQAADRSRPRDARAGRASRLHVPVRAVVLVAIGGSLVGLAAGVRPAQPVEAGRHLGPAQSTPEPWHLRPLGYLGGATHAVAGSGSIVFAGLGARVVALDVGDPAAPVQVGESPVLAGVVQDLAVEGDLLYVALQAGSPKARRGGLAVLGVADPTRIEVLRAVPVDVATRRLAVADGVALMVGGYDRQVLSSAQRGALLPVDPRPVDAPAIGRHVPFEGGAVAIARAGNRAYVLEPREFLDAVASIHALHAPDPMRPATNAVVNMPGPPKGIAATTSALYVASGRSGLRVVDVAPDGTLADRGRASAQAACSDDVALSPSMLASLDACAGRLMLFGLTSDGWPALLGEVAVPKAGERVAWIGDLIAVAGGAEGGVLLVDVQRPDAPVVRGGWVPAGGVGAVAALAVRSDPALLVAAHPRAGITTLGLGEPEQMPRPIGHLDIAGVEDISLVGRHLVATDDEQRRLDVIDLADPTQPRSAGSLALAEALDVLAHPDLELAYVAGHQAGLRVIDLSRPAAPSIAASLESLSSMALAIGGGGVVALRHDGLSTIDISDPMSPREAGSTPRFAMRGADELVFAASPDRAYVYILNQLCSLGDGGFECARLEVVDLSNPEEPMKRAEYPMFREPNPSAVAFADGLVFLGGGTGLTVTDAATLDDAFDPLATYGAPGLVMDVAVLPADGDGRTVLVAEGDGGLGVYRLVDKAPVQPSATSSQPLPTPRPASTAVATAAPKAPHRIHLPLVAKAPVAAPKRAALRIARTLAGPADGLAVGDGVVYFGTGGSIAAFELGPNGPREVGHSAELPGRLRDIVVDGDRLFAAVGELGLAVFSVADPRRPVLLGIAPTGGTARGVVVSGSLAYVAAGDAGLEVFDVAGAPRRLSTTPVGRTTRRVWLDRGHAYISTMDNTPIEVFDVANPHQPRRVAALEGWAPDGWALAFYDRYAYVQSCTSCIEVFDVSEPSAPELVPLGPQSSPFLEIGADDIAIEGRTMLTAGGNRGLDVFDLTNPISPTLMGSVPMRWPMGWERVAVRDGLAATASESGDDALHSVNPTVVELFDVTAIEAPVSLGSVVSPLVGASGLLPSADANHIYVLGNHLELLNGARDAPPPAPSGRDERHQIGFSEDAWLLDVSEPDAPRAGPDVPSLAGTTAMVIDGTTGYAIRSGRSIAVLDLAVAAEPRLLSELDLGQYLLTIASAGTTTIVRGQEASLTSAGWVFTTTLHVVDASDPAHPMLARTVKLPPGTSLGWGLAMSGTTAWVHGIGGIRALDVSDPGQPRWVGELAIPGIQGGGATTNFVARGDRLWVGAVDGLVTVDIGDPANPRIVGRAPGGVVYALWPWGDGLLLAGGCGATAYDVSGPGAATNVATLEYPPYAPLRCGLDVVSGVAANGRFYAQLDNEGAGGAVVLEIVTE